MFFEPSNALAEQRQPMRRNDSFSTVSSSVAAADIMQQYANLSKAVASRPTIATTNPTAMRVENSEGVHVGDIIYHIHHHGSKNDTKSIRSVSIDSSTSDTFKMEKVKKFALRQRQWKPIWIIPIGISIIFIATAITLSIYFTLITDPNEDDPSSTVDPTTTPLADDTTTTPLTDETTTPREPEAREYFVTREEWGAEEPKSTEIPRLAKPIRRIIIGHTGGDFCTTKNACISVVKSLQFNQASNVDIPFNFLVGGDGRIYEGRGFDFEGQHTHNTHATEYNSIGICIAFIGNYQNTEPDPNQLQVLEDFIVDFTKDGEITENHIIVSQDDLKYFSNKATALNAAVTEMKKFRELYKIYRREEWNAKPATDLKIYYDRIMDWVLIGHTVTETCNNLETCAARARSIQNDAFNRGYQDTLYNFMFGGNGYALEGRGWDLQAAHAIGFNDISIGVGAIGNFESTPPNDAIINAMLRVYDDAMALGKLTDDYKIFGRADFRGPGPGTAFMNIIRRWCRYGNGTNTC